jgi:hypothetical protein
MLARLVLAWGLSRLAIVTLMIVPSWYPAQQPVVGDLTLYADWARHSLAHGHVPVDERWQYPLGAAGVMLVPDWMPLPYPLAFLLLVLTADAALLALLIRRRTTSAIAFWLVAPLALGPVFLPRYDLLPAVLGAAAVTMLVSAPRLAGLAIAAGAWLKVWPLVLLVGARRSTTFRWTALCLAVPLVVLAGTGHLGGATAFIKGQNQRGLEVESIAGTPLVAGRLAGVGPAPSYQFGSWQYDVTWGRAVGPLGVALMVTGLLWLAKRVDQGLPPADAALTAVLVVLCTAKVLSPQYLTWALAIAAVALTNPTTRLRGPCAMLILVALLSQVEYPLRFDDVLLAEPLGSVALIARNLTLLAATTWALVRAARPPRTAEGARVLAGTAHA